MMSFALVDLWRSQGCLYALSLILSVLYRDGEARCHDEFYSEL